MLNGRAKRNLGTDTTREDLPKKCSLGNPAIGGAREPKQPGVSTKPALWGERAPAANWLRQLAGGCGAYVTS
jgi:hypothetical protein